jgi:multidrug transporter EmrE-like cation transporter
MTEHLSRRGLALAAATALCSAVGIVLIKNGLKPEALHIAPLLAGLVIYAAGIILGMLLIGRYALSVAYPIVVGLSLVILAAISFVALGEVLTPLKVAGTLLIMLGVVLLVKPSEHSRRG